MVKAQMRLRQQGMDIPTGCSEGGPTENDQYVVGGGAGPGDGNKQDRQPDEGEGEGLEILIDPTGPGQIVIFIAHGE